MRLLVIAGNYAPEKTASGPLTTDFCQFMRQSGHSVTVVTTFPHYPQWKIWEGYEWRLYQSEDLDGIRVLRVRNYVPASPTTFKRVAYYGSFSALAFPLSLAAGRPDLILCVTPPLELAVTAYALGKIWRTPFALWIKDLVPDVAIQLGLLKSRWAIDLARRLECFAYSRAVKLIVICEGFAKNLYLKSVPEEKVTVIPDWVDVDSLRPDYTGASFRLPHGIDSRRFLVLHVGNIGAKQRLEFLVRAAKLLERYKDIVFLIVGDGAKKANVVEEAERLEAMNVRFLPFQPDAIFPEMLAAADVLVVHQHRAVMDSVVPSKLLVYMASGRAVVLTAAQGSETQLLVGRAGCGIAVEPGKPAELAQTIFRLYQDPQLRARCGMGGRSYVCQNRSRSVILPRLESLLRTVAAK